MKKTSIILVIVICIASFFAISFWGQAVDSGQFKNYITEIVITNDTSSIPGGGECIFVDFDDDEGYGTVTVMYDYYPEDAEDYTVTFSVSNVTFQDASIDADEADSLIIVSDMGEVTFLARASLTLTLLATDGGGAKASVTIICS